MTNWLDRLQEQVRKAQSAVQTTLEREQAAFVLGKVAGRTVMDKNGEIIVESGRVIEQATVERALACGMLTALVSSVAAAGLQDLQERIADVRAATPDGAEERALDSADDYARARLCVGKRAGLDVTDIRGNVLVPRGTQIREADIRAAREAGLLNALIHSASVPLPETPAGQTGDTESPEYGERPQESPPPSRPKLPLLHPDQDRPG